MKPLLLFALALMAGLAAGWYLAPRNHGVPPESVAPDSSKRQGLPKPDRASVVGEASGRAIAGLLETAFRSGRIGYPEIRALIQALDSLSADTLTEFTEFFTNQSMHKEQLLLWRLFLAAWGEFDPEGAMAFIDRRFDEPSTRRFFYAAVIESWQHSAADDAFEFALASFAPTSDGENAIESHLAIDYLRGLAESDPQRALQLAMRLNDGEFVLEMTALRISQLAERDRDLALDAIESLSGDTHFHAASQFVIDWARSDPAEASNWLSSHFDDRYNAHILGQIARSYVGADPAGALAWISGLPEASDRPKIFAAAISEWFQVDPQATLDWLSESGSRPELDDATVALSYQRAETDPQEVIEQWVPMIADPQKGNELLAEVSSEWQRVNPDGFAEWLEHSVALPAEVKQRLLGRESPADALPDGAAGAGAQEPRGDQGRGR